MAKLISNSVMLLLVVAWAGASGGRAAPPPDSAPTTSVSGATVPTTQPAAADNQSDVLTFREDKASAAGRLGGGARGEGDGPEVFLLVSARLGRTVSARPTIYWYLTEDTEADLDLVIAEPAASQPLFRKRYQGHFEKGLHDFSLAEASEDLKPGVRYQVTVTIQQDPADPSVNPFSTGLIERVAPPASLAAAGQAPTASEYCQEGLWYDALEALTRAIAREPANPHLRHQRLGLLRQQQVFLSFAPDKKWATLPGIPQAQARAKQRETQLLDSLAAEDAREIGLSKIPQ